MYPANTRRLLSSAAVLIDQLSGRAAHTGWFIELRGRSLKRRLVMLVLFD